MEHEIFNHSLNTMNNFELAEKKLFAVYLGGRADRCNIELHDVVFVVGSNLEETYPTLAKKWFGNLNQFHIDSYIHLKYIDGYEIELVKDPSEVDLFKKLYFINLGAYKSHDFTEYHESAFYVAETSHEAVKRAKSELCQGLNTIHKDDVLLIDKVSHTMDFDVDDVLEISEIDDYYISLKPTASTQRSIPFSAYIKLDLLVAK